MSDPLRYDAFRPSGRVDRNVVLCAKKYPEGTVARCLSISDLFVKRFAIGKRYDMGGWTTINESEFDHAVRWLKVQA